MSWGSWTELIVGIGAIAVAAVLGTLAWIQSKEASRWAKRSTELQHRANELAEASLPVGFRASMRYEIYRDPDQLNGERFDAWLVLQSPDGVSSVVIHGVETVGAYFGPRSFGRDLFGRHEITPNRQDIELPRRLHPGESIGFFNPWPSFVPELVTGSWATVRILFSVLDDSPVRPVEVDVALPEPVDD